MVNVIKGKTTVIGAVLLVILLVIAVTSCNQAGKLKAAHDQEMAKRLDSEEKLNKLTQDKSAQEGKVAELARELEAQKAAHEITKKALLQEQSVNQSLKIELEKINKLKEKLEENLREVSAADKSAIKVKK